VSVALVSDTRVRALNRTYRKKDYDTDVLSFPTEPQPAAAASPAEAPKGRRRTTFLGDIVIARGVARRQAREAGHDEQTELRVLALHGLLHLLGYDHETDEGEMRRVEARLRRQGGLREGLIERGYGHPEGERGSASPEGPRSQRDSRAGVGPREHKK
jgi:probable rRNA maturation factor